MGQTPHFFVNGVGLPAPPFPLPLCVSRAHSHALTFRVLPRDAGFRVAVLGGQPRGGVSQSERSGFRVPIFSAAGRAQAGGRGGGARGRAICPPQQLACEGRSTKCQLSVDGLLCPRRTLTSDRKPFHLVLLCDFQSRGCRRTPPREAGHGVSQPGWGAGLSVWGCWGSRPTSVTIWMEACPLHGVTGKGWGGL